MNDSRTSEDEADALGEKTWEIERRIIDTTPQTPVGLMVLVKLLARYQEIGPGFTDQRERDLGRNILAALERLTPGPVAAPDPVVTLFAEWGTIQDEADALSAANPEAKTGELNDRWEAALDRRDVVG